MPLIPTLCNMEQWIKGSKVGQVDHMFHLIGPRRRQKSWTLRECIISLPPVLIVRWTSDDGVC